MQYPCIYQTTPRRHILQLQCTYYIEFPQLVELTQKLHCVCLRILVFPANTGARSCHIWAGSQSVVWHMAVVVVVVVVAVAVEHWALSIEHLIVRLQWTTWAFDCAFAMYDLSIWLCICNALLAEYSVLLANAWCVVFAIEHFVRLFAHLCICRFSIWHFFFIYTSIWHLRSCFLHWHLQCAVSAIGIWRLCAFGVGRWAFGI